MGATKRANWIKPMLVVLLAVTFIAGCSSQNMQMSSSQQPPATVAAAEGDSVVTLAAGDALGRQLFVGKTQPAGPAVATAN